MTANLKPQNQAQTSTKSKRSSSSANLTSLPSITGRHPNDGWPLARPYAMSHGTQRALKGLIRALIPPAPAPQWDGMLDTLTQRTRVLMAYMHPVTAVAFVWMIRLLDWAPIWRFSARRRLQKLSQSDASAFLGRLGHSRVALFRQMVLGIRACVMSAYYDESAVHQALHYHPEPFFAERIALRKRMKAGGHVVASDYMVSHAGEPA